MNSGAFNLGAGLSFAILFAVNTAVTSASGPVAGYRFGILTGAVLLGLALAVSTLIPAPDDTEDEVGAASSTEQEAGAVAHV